jgi:hypothetical protein
MDIQTERIEGKAIEIDGREFVPVVHRTTGIWRGATVSKGYSGHGGGFVHLRPTGIIERKNGQEHVTPIVDQTANTLRAMVIAAIVVPLVLIAAIRLSARRKNVTELKHENDQGG